MSGAAIHVVLVSPEIPPNTGNVIRLCANTGAQLHLVEPLGFAIDDKHLRRAGLDYHEYASMRVHANWSACQEALLREHQACNGKALRLFAMTTKAQSGFAEVRFEPGDVIVFGCETRGLPAELLAEFPDERRIRLPMRPGNRSLNLSNSVAVVVYEAWRQAGFIGGA
jgi:tRNA (cytidine/uridine-2'-O-)-methyltransferase